MESGQNIERNNAESNRKIMRIGIAADHGGFELKVQLLAALTFAGYRIKDFGALELVDGDDYPDFVVPMAKAVSRGEITRGLAICGSGVGACVAANKVSGVRAALISDSFSAHQGVEDDNMNIMCLGGLVTGYALAWDLVQTFLSAHFKDDERFKRRLLKVEALEISENADTITHDLAIKTVNGIGESPSQMKNKKQIQ
jgi:ribose 5-phosphate isomerase B